MRGRQRTHAGGPVCRTLYTDQTDRHGRAIAGILAAGAMLMAELAPTTPVAARLISVNAISSKVQQ